MRTILVLSLSHRRWSDSTAALRLLTLATPLFSLSDSAWSNAFPASETLLMAQHVNVDPVCFAPTASPPVLHEEVGSGLDLVGVVDWEHHIE